jgi:hypothetical protein
MYGKIYFNSVAELALFLNCFQGSTAIFTVNKVGQQWVLEFTGGY